MFSIALFSFSRLCAQNDQGKVIIISDQVGEVIDLEERNKYNLFPGIRGFQSAVFLILPNGSYFCKITYLDETTGEEKVRRFPQIKAAIQQLRKIINKKSQEKIAKGAKRTELAVSFSPSPGGMISISRYSTYGIGLELNSVFMPIEDELDAIISGNFILSPPIISKAIPFGTIGLGICIHGVPFFNFGGGIKIRLTDQLGIRTEYRYYLESGYGGIGIILTGISFFVS